MNISQLKIKLNELKANLINPSVQDILENKKFDLDKLNKAIENYLINIEQIEDENLLKTIENKIGNVFNYTNKSSFELYINEFINAANFLISNAPINLTSIDNELKVFNESEISEDEFSMRYDKLIEALNFEDEECNLILETPSKEKKPFKVFKNKNKSLAIYAKSSEKPMPITADRLLEVAFHRKEPTYKSYELVIISKIIDNSIFDFFQNNSSSKDLMEAIKAKSLKNEDELIVINNKLDKIEEENQNNENKIERLNEVLKKAETLDSKIKAAEDYAKLNASVSYWKLKQEKHKNEFWKFASIAIVFIVVLICILAWFLNSHISNEVGSAIQKNGISLNIDKNESNLEFKETLPQMEKNNLLNNFDYNKLAWYILMIFASSSAFWIIRITVKIALSNLHLSEDAHERVVMIQTYLSFVNEGELKDEKDKNLVLSSLFRPSNIGIIQDESSVTVSDIITAFKK